VTIAGSLRGGAAWPGVSWALALVAAALAFAGAALRRRRLAAPAALALAGVCAFDGVRDLSGSGARWVEFPFGHALDVLPLWLPVALLLAAAALALERPSARPSPAHVRGVAWALVPVVAATLAPARLVALHGAVVLVVVLVGLGAADRRYRLAGALALAAFAPALAWLGGGLLPVLGPALAYAYLGAAGVLTLAGVVAAARRSRPADR
jgi:hypothetical protein